MSNLIKQRVGWETPEEHDLEQRAFRWANEPALADEIRLVIKELWAQYVMAAAELAARDAGVSLTPSPSSPNRQGEA